ADCGVPTAECRLRSADCLLSQQISCYEQRIRRTLCQTSHEVGIPLCPERDIDAHSPALLHELTLQVTSNSVEHLEFEGAGGNLFCLRESDRGFDHLLVVRSDAVIDAALKQNLHQLHVIGIDIALVG